mmetsp:Transcript_17566/g.45084  ORF Transcript_17566/g.45084 Transcript_17566/m.45084 type:complete len:316 (-) Transcript_17566:180-1127(-)
MERISRKKSIVEVAWPTEPRASSCRQTQSSATRANDSLGSPWRKIARPSRLAHAASPTQLAPLRLVTCARRKACRGEMPPAEASSSAASSLAADACTKAFAAAFEMSLATSLRSTARTDPRPAPAAAWTSVNALATRCASSEVGGPSRWVRAPWRAGGTSHVSSRCAARLRSNAPSEGFTSSVSSVTSFACSPGHSSIGRTQSLVQAARRASGKRAERLHKVGARSSHASRRASRAGSCLSTSAISSSCVYSCAGGGDGMLSQPSGTVKGCSWPWLKLMAEHMPNHCRAPARSTASSRFRASSCRRASSRSSGST